MDRSIGHHEWSQSALPARARVQCSRVRVVRACGEQDSQDAKRERKFLNKMGWGYCILDEGHSIKNAGSKRYKRLSQLQCSSKLLLTGTPIQNNAQEIFSILHFLLPKIFTEERLEQLQEASKQATLML
jgi:hypothetical protein